MVMMRQNGLHFAPQSDRCSFVFILPSTLTFAMRMEGLAKCRAARSLIRSPTTDNGGIREAATLIYNY